MRVANQGEKMKQNRRTIQRKPPSTNKKLSVSLPKDAKIIEVIGITNDGAFYKLQASGG